MSARKAKKTSEDLNRRLAAAVRHFWITREDQSARQGSASGIRDTGNRGCVTGGKQMDGFEILVRDLLLDAGIPKESIYCSAARELPGYFRAEKNWDLLVVHQGALVAAMEFKSHVGSFGNNFNNRTEEALGNATDLWTAYREGAFRASQRPWLGYLIMLEDAARTTTPVRVCEPHFQVFDEFRGASYSKRYELLLIRLLRERLYDGVGLVMSNSESGRNGKYREPNAELTFSVFASSLIAHVGKWSDFGVK